MPEPFAQPGDARHAPAPSLPPGPASADGAAIELTPESLIPMLQQVQASEGYVSHEAMLAIASALHTTPAKVYGVATFYNQFRFAPLGRHVIEVCRGTACHVKESLGLARHLERRLKLRPDGNSRDNTFTIIPVACLGACSIAPVVKIDGEFHGHLTLDKLDKLIDAVLAADEPRSE